MDVRFVQPDLRRLDELRSEALSLPFFADERPLRGALGLVDWRLAGEISRLILRGRISGALGERVLVPARPKLPFEKLFLFGVGERAAFDEAVFESAVEGVLDTLGKARVRASVCALPGRALGLVEPERAMEMFLRVSGLDPEQDEITLVEDAEAQKAMVPIVERERRKARAPAPI